jgi:hypothetical protein
MPRARLTLLPFRLCAAIAAAHDRLIMLRLLRAISLHFIQRTAKALGLFPPLGRFHHFTRRRHAFLLSQRSL